MIPVATSVPIRHPPVMVWGIIAANVAVFGLEMAMSETQLAHFATLWGVVPARFLASEWVGDYIYNSLTAVTSTFFHGGLLHILVNMWFLWVFGHNVEDFIGPLRFLLFYLGCGMASGLASLVFVPTSTIPTIGASGAVAGILGAYLVMFPRTRLLVIFPLLFFPIFFTVPAVIYLAVWFLIQYFSMGSLTPSGDEADVAWWAHLAGFLAGLSAGPLLVRHKRFR